MLDKTQVLPIGSMITVMFSCDENKETVAVIVGHLTLRGIGNAVMTMRALSIRQESKMAFSM